MKLFGFSFRVGRERRRKPRNTFTKTWAHTNYSTDTKESNVYEYGIPTHVTCNSHLRSYPHSHFFGTFLQDSYFITRMHKILKSHNPDELFDSNTHSSFHSYGYYFYGYQRYELLLDECRAPINSLLLC